MSSLYEKVNTIFANTLWKEGFHEKRLKSNVDEQKGGQQIFLLESCKDCESVKKLRDFYYRNRSVNKPQYFSKFIRDWSSGQSKKRLCYKL